MRFERDGVMFSDDLIEMHDSVLTACIWNSPNLHMQFGCLCWYQPGPDGEFGLWHGEAELLLRDIQSPPTSLELPIQLTDGTLTVDGRLVPFDALEHEIHGSIVVRLIVNTGDLIEVHAGSAKLSIAKVEYLQPAPLTSGA
jgi:hypothetical protein